MFHQIDSMGNLQLNVFHKNLAMLAKKRSRKETITLASIALSALSEKSHHASLFQTINYTFKLFTNLHTIKINQQS